MRLAALAAAFALASAFGVQAAVPTQGELLNENSCWRQYYCFRVNRISPAALAAEGPAVLGAKGMANARKEGETWMRQFGLDPAKGDWRDYVLLARRGAREFMPTPTPLPPADWASVDFDDSSWVREWHVFQGGRAAQMTDEILGQFDESVDLRLRAAFYRGRFVLDARQQQSPLSVRVAYSGGARVFVNGVEIARGHLPQGNLGPNAAAQDYPAAAYSPAGAALVRRTLGSIAVPPPLLRDGVNVLALEILASDVHPVVLNNPIQPNWGGPRRPFPHARLFEVSLAGATAAPPSVGPQIWVEDIHRRVETTDRQPPGEAAGTIRFVGARNGTYGAQVVVRSPLALSGLQVTPGDLSRDGGGTVPAEAIAVEGIAPYPVQDFTATRLGDERGLNATFPDGPALARAEALTPGRPAIFDHITPDLQTEIPADTACPIWLSLTVPPRLPAGTYTGAVSVRAQGMSPVSLPVVAEVIDWTLPDAQSYRTLVGCEENPYAVARQYGVPLWSDRHFELMKASFRQLSRIGNQWLNVPVLRNTEMGNGDDSPIRWTLKRDGTLAFDYSVLDRYLDMAVAQCGPPRVLRFIVMHGMPQSAAPEVNVRLEADGRVRPIPMRTSGPDANADAARLWTAFAASLCAHMKARNLNACMFWGAPWEGEADPNLKVVLAAAAPDVGWTAGPHEMMSNGVYAKASQYYKLVADIRYHGGWSRFRDDQGWRSQTLHPLNPRVGGTCMAVHTTSNPFAFRVLPDRALAMGRSGFTRIGADGWAGTNFSGMAIPRWMTGMPVLFMLWPSREGAESSLRFEALREGVQEAEARISIEQALAGGRVPPDVAKRARETLSAHFQATDFFLGNSLIYSFEENYGGWQERSRRLYAAAAEVQRAAR